MKNYKKEEIAIKRLKLNNKIIFMTGTFDVLQTGHFKVLEFSKSLGTQLIVAIDSDKRVKQLKGENRPYFNQEERKYNLESIKWVDKVHVFDSDEDLISLLKQYNPIRVVGSDWQGKKIIGEEYCKEIVYFERLNKYSTTAILNYGLSNY